MKSGFLTKTMWKAFGKEGYPGPDILLFGTGPLQVLIIVLEKNWGGGIGNLDDIVVENETHDQFFGIPVYMSFKYNFL